MEVKKEKPGINKAIKCKKCNHTVGFVTVKPRLKWRTIKYMIAIALVLEIIANAVVYIIFEWI